jgi:Glycosyl hydrolases family 43
MRIHLAAIAGVFVCLSATHCAAPVDEETEDTSEALSSSVAGKQSDDPIEVKPKGDEFDGAFASPTIVRVGSVYHAWFAKQRIGGKIYNTPHAVLGANGKWKLQGDALPRLGKRAKDAGTGYAVWAPAVAKIDDGRWVLYYSSTLAGTTEKKCIWRAHAASADGPFVDDFDGPIECLGGSLWAIDPYLVKAGSNWHLAARLDEPGGINTIKIRELADNGTRYAGSSAWKELVHNAPKSWEQPVLENAAIVRLAPQGGGAPHWYVFYSGRAWDNNSYAVGYADCGPSLGGGPCEKKTKDGPWMATNKDANLWGPGTPTFYTDESGDDMMSLQVWEHSGGKSNPKNNGQSMRTYKVTVGANYHPSAKHVRFDR